MYYVCYRHNISTYRYILKRYSMSFQLFISDIQKEPLTPKRLQEVWEFCNLKNKSPLIDRLTKSLFNEFKKRSDKISKEQDKEIIVDNISFTPAEVSNMCTRFTNEIVKRSIPAQKPLLESLPPNVAIGHNGWSINPNTSIVFRPRNADIVISKENNPSDWIATRVLKGGRLYPLKLGHFNVCITNGWFFETEVPSISSPFRVVDTSK